MQVANLRHSAQAAVCSMGMELPAAAGAVSSSSSTPQVAHCTDGNSQLRFDPPRLGPRQKRLILHPMYTVESAHVIVSQLPASAVPAHCQLYASSACASLITARCWISALSAQHELGSSNGTRDVGKWPACSPPFPGG